MAIRPSVREAHGFPRDLRDQGKRVSGRRGGIARAVDVMKSTAVSARPRNNGPACHPGQRPAGPEGPGAERPGTARRGDGAMLLGTGEVWA